MKKISLIIPVHNESANLKWHAEKINAYFKTIDFNKEIIYIDDGSSDNSWDIIREIAAHDKDTVCIRFSRNFGKEAATTAGLQRSSGDAAVMIDADGQHPIEFVTKFIEKWEAGAQVVVGVRSSNKNEGTIKKYGSILFNKALYMMSGQKTVSGATDFRLLDRKVIDAFNALTERNRITRGLIDWLGFRRDFVHFAAHERHAGKATYSFKKLIRLAVHAFVSHSTKPLQFTGFLGFIVMALSCFFGLFIIIQDFILGDPLNLNVSGTAILAVFLSFMLGVVLICQWLLALYIESIHNETQNRPLYIIDEELS